MDETQRLFTDGIANPSRFGLSLRSSAGVPPDPQRLAEAAAQLERPVAYTDEDGTECELIGAALHSAGDIAYVESRARESGQSRHSEGYVDVSIRVHLIESSGQRRSADIESYNPFFGCDVRLFEWHDRTALLIYREKH